MAGTDTPTSTTSDTPSNDDTPIHSRYRLRVTAGPAHDTATHKLVPVNAPETLTFENSHMIISIAVRIRRFTGYPDDSPETSAYFDHDLHKWDQYSIAFAFIPKVDIPGDDLIFGNDFDRPIRDRLPPGFNQAFKIVKWWVDPGLEGDVYGDKPYLFGPALSSWNYLRICEQVVEGDQLDATGSAWKIPNGESFHETVVEEGGQGDGVEARRDMEVPDDAAARKKHFLTQANREQFLFEAGRLYQSDFGNPYLDFNDFSLKLPGFSLNVIKYVDSKTHELRYTLKNKSTDEIYACVLFTLLFGEELEVVEKVGVEEAMKEMSLDGASKNKDDVKSGSGGGGDDEDDIIDPPPQDDDVD